MTDRPIIFSAPMVRALLDGRKRMTRRVLRPQPPEGHRLVGIYAPGLTAVFNPAGRDHRGDPDQDLAVRLPGLGDRLWVREAWGHDAPDLDTCRRGVESDGMSYGPYYMADGRWADNHTIRKQSPIYMPRWASRLTLIVTNVRVQRLHEISEEDAIAEGVEPFGDGVAFVRLEDAQTYSTVRGCFGALWRSIHGPGAWEQNPWVCAISFDAIRANIDEVPA